MEAAFTSGKYQMQKLVDDINVRVWPKRDEMEDSYEQLMAFDADRKVMKDYSYQEGLQLLFHFRSTVLQHGKILIPQKMYS
jgi:hypothetical protein